ncbi:MAG: TIGR03668 family PPOX class F420-dependent oxidoreductase [Acetobacteraceae bacterium]|nr:TIGR03668 family PPOX class F420-dependent oxidoreductase [Acetobacteraceae bacterium]
MNAEQHNFLVGQRVAHLATADRNGIPHVIPICYAVAEDRLYVAIDEKPKRHNQPLKRLRNITENPAVAVIVDHYEEDWSRLGWVLLRGRATLLHDGPEFTTGLALLRARYPQYDSMNLETNPIIAVHIERVTSWGTLQS